MKLKKHSSVYKCDKKRENVKPKNGNFRLLVTNYILSCIKLIREKSMPEKKIYSEILNKLNDACVIFTQTQNPAGSYQHSEIVMVNPSAERLFMFQTENMLGMDIRDVWTAAFGGETNREFYEFFVPGTEKNINGQGEIFCDKQGLWLSIKIFPVCEEKFAAIFQDISAIRIKELNERKQELLSILAHDIRAPISNISGLSEILLTTPLSEEQNDYAMMISHTASELCILINTIMDAARNASGKNRKMEVEFDLLMVMDIITDMFSLKINQKGLEFVCEIEKNVPLVLCGDSMRLKQIIMNIVSNACKFTDSGQICIHISCENISNEEIKLLINISDTGKGIETELMNNIFEPFAQSEKKGSIDGWGFGMNIVHQNLSLLEGEISIKSQPGRGSSFQIALPMKKAENQQSHYDTKKFQGKNILILEPEEATRKSLIQILEREDCNIYPLNNIEQIMQSDFFRYKFTGKVLLNIDQPEFLIALKSGCVNFFRNGNIQWIGLTRGHKHRNFHKLGLSACIPKPVRFSHLFTTIS
jgi:signal transduction histidine kinase